MSFLIPCQHCGKELPDTWIDGLRLQEQPYISDTLIDVLKDLIAHTYAPIHN